MNHYTFVSNVINFSLLSALPSYPHWKEVERESYLLQLSHCIDRISLSMHHGNTDQIGHAAWNGMINKMQKAIMDFIKEINRLYIENEEYRNKEIVEYQAKVDELQNRGNLPEIG